MAECQARAMSKIKIKCHNPAAAAVEFMCPREHRRVCRVCEKHLARLDEAKCKVCFLDHGEVIKMHVRIVEKL